MSLYEKQGEKNTTDKVKPKFKVGDWVVNRFGDVWHIDSFDSKNYQVSNGNGNKYCYFPIEKQDEMRHWTIQDAKDSDVLCDYHEAYNNPLIFILKKFEHVNFGLVRPSDYSSYCFLTAGHRQRFKEGTYHHEHNIKPATKEQRDLLFVKIKKAGYEWDAENKELKKPTEWSREDENRFSRICGALKRYEMSLGASTNDIEWLKQRIRK